ncbi:MULTISPECIES: SDR family NAD(P)-dependent oxidoreductase [Mycobacterium]|uniref:Ketoacyl reductase n=1 Tax=Mycobacterium kiyosense TaxID=2871094 RepID=A0A9P3UXX8_9MYCO|nr:MULTISPECIES: SDR family NAD(P)-dependent oxidoreductase [Mycobacterium]BDB44208.1 ketoacyl reductase [Mycobacterium kiyosense]BDE15744.1 ketoacyl reductase [Mycobacterium sp. 20KCMC460]GLB80863.1 ketoacyl reductase [Mycobacterium kiyosense]GLB87399.1 ketoacyl reductase [Mycobacterium kiyosense]GLB93343.1 ketoacyl reductase [Mycobacterium kiyosense]
MTSGSRRGLPAPRRTGTALVTGASSGIGDEFARQLSARGHHVTLAARRADRLEKLAGELGDALPVRCDVADPQSRANLLGAITDAGRQVDVLINCAGFGGGGPVCEFDPDRAVEMLRTNVEAVFALCGALTPAMAARRSGAVVIVSSLAGILCPPVNFAAYGASKGASLRYAHALHYEMAKVDVSVTALCPGPIDTEFGVSSGLEKTMSAMPAFAKATPADCVAAAFAALQRGRREAIPNAVVRVAATAARRTPAVVASRVLPAFFRV